MKLYCFCFCCSDSPDADESSFHHITNNTIRLLHARRHAAQHRLLECRTNTRQVHLISLSFDLLIPLLWLQLYVGGILSGLANAVRTAAVFFLSSVCSIINFSRVDLHLGSFAYLCFYFSVLSYIISRHSSLMLSMFLTFSSLCAIYLFFFFLFSHNSYSSALTTNISVWTATNSLVHWSCLLE